MKNEYKNAGGHCKIGKKLTDLVRAGGCAAKIGPSQLMQIVGGLEMSSDANVLTTIRSFEDAGVYKISEELALVQTVDFFPAPVDDPYLFGRIAAANALSDIYAMGARPLTALSIFSFPVCDFPLEISKQIIQGAADAVAQAGAVIVGGHSIQGPEPVFGLSVTGLIHPQHILTNGGARAGDVLVLTKQIGTGVLLLAHRAGLLSDHLRKVLESSLISLNDKALKLALPLDPHAATDITGFGLIGHAHEMSKASGLQCRLETKTIPFFPESLPFAAQGMVPAGAYSNRELYEKIAYINDGIDLCITDLLFDPQTSGGLLFALSAENAARLVEALEENDLPGAIIGRFVDGVPGKVEVI